MTRLALSSIFMLLLAVQVLAAPQGYSYPEPSGAQLPLGTGGLKSESDPSSHSSSSSSSSHSSSSSSSSHSSPSSSSSSTGAAQIAILREERQDPDETGAYSFNYESEDGAKRTETGEATGPEGSVVKSGEYSYPLPDGQTFTLSFVADAEGFKPQSDHLPVAPEIPEFVKQQIEKAEAEDAAAAAGERSVPAPGQSYLQPEVPDQSHLQPEVPEQSHLQPEVPEQSYLQPEAPAPAAPAQEYLAPSRK